MKKYYHAIIIALLITACNTQVKEADNKEMVSEQEMVSNPEDMLFIQYEVHGMTCEGCEKAINSSIKNIEGIAEVSSSHVDSVTKVKFDKTKTSIDEIQAAIENTGYSVESYEIVAE